MKRVLISDPIAPGGLEILKDRGLEIVDVAGQGVEAIAEVASTVHGWIIRSGTRVNEELLNLADNLQVVGRAGVGVDNIDIPAATLRGVVVMNTPDVNTISAAEHTLAMMMALARNVHLGHSSLKAGKWDRKNLQGIELRGKVLGVVGLGRIGQQVMSYARSLGMQVIGYDPYAPPELKSLDWLEIVELDALLERSDLITLHVPKNDATVNLINAERMGKMKRSALLVNCARGGIINEADLAKALHDGVFAGAALDVFSSEPLDSKSPLIETPNLLLTPHLGASTREAQEGVALAICTQVADYLLDGKLESALNMPVGDMALLKKMEYHLQLATTMGKMLIQMVEGSLQSVKVECFGTAEEPEIITLATVLGLLEQVLDVRVNYVNAAAVAKERGIQLTHSYGAEHGGGYANLMKITISTDKGTMSMSGSVFGGHYPRVVSIDEHHLELNPEGVMLFIRNRDIPGVLGTIGTTLGHFSINIGEALLSRERSKEDAYLVVKVDSVPDEAQLDILASLDGITSVKKVVV